MKTRKLTRIDTIRLHCTVILQVLSRETGDYVDAGYIEGGIFVNIGDLLQMWSGDVLIANVSPILLWICYY